jgi:hypothetical protein
MSTLFPQIGPAGVLLPALSDTTRLPVQALELPPGAVTVVLKLKLASAGLANPDPGGLSVAVQPMLTLLACQFPSAVPQFTTGGTLSKQKGPWVLSLVVPPLSHARTCAVWHP